MYYVVTDLDDPKATFIQIRATDEEKAAVKAAAKLDGMQMSPFIMQLVTQRIEEIRSRNPPAFAELKDRILTQKKQSVPLLKEKAK